MDADAGRWPDLVARHPVPGCEALPILAVNNPAVSEPESAEEPHRYAVVAAFGRLVVESRDLSTVIGRAVESAAEVVHAPMAGLVRVVARGQVEVVATRGVAGAAGPTEADAGAEWTVTPDVPPDRIAQPLIVPDWSAQTRFSQVPRLRDLGVRATLSVGVLAAGVVWLLTVHDHRARAFGPTDVDVVQTIAHLLGLALERDHQERTYAAMIDRGQAVTTFGRFALQSSDVDATIERALEIVREVLNVPAVAVSRPSGPGRHVMVHAHGPIGMEPGTEFEVPPDLIAAVEDLTAPLAIDDWRSETRFGQVPATRAAGVRSSLSVGVPVGRQDWRLVAVDTCPRRFRCFEVGFLQSIGNLLATALERQRAETLLRDSNRQLQQALLPGDLPTLPGITATARYVPAGGDLVGGDWYDLLPLPHGGIGLVMGDVEGHDSTAAAMMGQIRTVLRAYAADGRTPAEILSELNRFVHGHLQRLVTCCYAELHPEQRTITYASAGHPTPLILEPGRELTALPSVPGLILGVNAEQDYGECTHLLPHARVILMVTDGLVDDLPGAIHEALASLVATAGRYADDPLETLADRLAGRPDDGRDQRDQCDQRDDAALLAVELRTAAPSSRDGVRRTFANRPVVTRTARSYVADVLVAWGLPGVRETASLVVSELVTNAIMHTTSPIQVALQRIGPERIRLTVRDESDLPLRPCHRPPAKAAVPLEPGGRGLIIVQHVADRWGIDLTPEGLGKAVWVELSATGGRPATSS